MKITKRQLRNIIREAINEKYGKDYTSTTHPGGKGEERNPQLDFVEADDALEEDKSGKGKCPDSGCISQRGDKWRIISNKTGKLWPQHYDTEEKAEAALDAYHVHN